jgi:chromosome segregation ATPase
MDLDLAAPDSTVVAPSPSPEVQPTQKGAGISSDPSLEFTAQTGTEDSIEEKDQSREFVYDKPGSTRAGTGSSEILAKAPGMGTEIKPDIKPEGESKEPEKVSFKVSDESVIKLEAIIRALREERESLVKEVKENRELKTKVLSENLNLEAATEELRVELAIIKKRNEEEFHEDSYEKRLINEKLKLAEEKNKRLQKDIDILSNQAQIDTNKVLQREKELENQLELLSIDTQNQILSREKKISELNRERDAMEYNMTNLVSREKKLRQEKVEIEEKLNKIMRTMRNSIDFLEDEIEGNQKLLKELKK